jgi:hypothetical protein
MSNVKLSQEYYEGWAAFEAILSDASNPYPDDSEPFKAWNAGYWAASDKYEDAAADHPFPVFD